MRDKLSNIRLIGLGLSAAWIVLLILFWAFAPTGEGPTISALSRLVLIVSAILPLVVVLLTVALVETVQSLRDETLRLRAQLARQAGETASPAARPPLHPRPSQPSQPAQPARPSWQTGSAAAKTSPQMPTTPTTAARGMATRQASMQFEDPDPIIIPNDTLIRAFNFPDDARDLDTIRALRTALQDHELARVLRAAQDVVTLLAKAGLFMEDLSPGTATAGHWRQFAEGQRGTKVAQIAVTDFADAVDIAQAKTRSDEIFRDSAHHFMRHFDQMLSSKADSLSDAELEALADTRSGRAFRLLGTVASIFSG